MSPLAVGGLGVGLLLALMALRMPIGFVMGIVGFLGFGYIAGFKPALSMLGTVPFTTAANFNLLPIPLFILMGQFAFHSGISRDLYYMAHKWLGHLPGGLAIATVGACAGFAAACGSSLATAATMGTVALPEMKKYNYDRRLATGTVAAGGTLGILIPPSIGFVIYGIITEQSIGRLLIAGILPGILLAGLFALSIYLRVRRNPALAPPAPPTPWRERLASLTGVWGILVLFLLVMGGIYMGVFTATEAAAVGAFGSFVFTFIKRQLTRKSLGDSLLESGRTTAMIFTIIIGAMVFGYFMAVTRLPVELADFIQGLPVNRYGTFAAIIVLYLILGCIMDTLAMILLTVPIIFPIVTGLGFDPIWFGVVMVINMEMGLITPPVGMNVFVISGIAKDVPMPDIFRGVLPFLIAMLLTIAIITIFPDIALVLPRLMKGA